MLNIRIGQISRLFSPGYGWCGRCKTTWNVVREHATMYDANHGCFPLCEKCWRELTPVERLPYYRQLYDVWEGRGPVGVSWPTIEAAVLAEGEPASA